MFPPPGKGSVICAFGELVQNIIIDGPDVLTALKGCSDIESVNINARFGGCAAATVAIAASLRAPARFVGHFGEDFVSSALIDQLQREGVRVFGVRRGRGASSICIRRPDGEMVYLHDPASSAVVTADDVRPWWLKDATVLHLVVQSIYNEGTRDAFWKLVDMAHAQELPISLDITFGSQIQAYGVDRLRSDIEKIKPAVVFCSATEARILRVQESFLTGASVVINHNGPDDTIVLMATGDCFTMSPPRVEEDEIVDLIGASDAFAGAFLTGWVGGRSLRDCVKLASEIASGSIKYIGILPVGDEDPARQPLVVA